MSLITNIEKCNEFTLISRKIKITKYNCDSGNRDLSSEKVIKEIYNLLKYYKKQLT